jgi:tetratricopeptide (TPR) repeat protein
MGFFYLLTLYAFVRGWPVRCVIACALGMGTKEVMATAPLIVLLYDRTFIATSFRAAWRERRPLHLSLAATWIVLAALVVSTGGNRGGTVGVAVGVPLWAYPLTQFKAIATYLARSVWPQPLVFEYGTFWAHATGDVLPYSLIVLPLLAGTIVALWRAPVIGFLGAWFLGILAPTSLAPGTIQMIVEHRMYLPLAGIITASAIGLQHVVGRRAWIALLAAAFAAGLITFRRNDVYSSHLTLWADTVAKRPENPRAHQGLAEAYSELGRTDVAEKEFAIAARLQPAESTYHYNLGLTVAKTGQFAKAIAYYEEALRLAPDEPRTHNNLAIALGQVGRIDEALQHYAKVERLAPDNPQYLFNHGIALYRAGRAREAIERYERALQLRPDYADVHFNLATALATTGQLQSALDHYMQAVRLAPDDAEIRSTFGGALLLASRPEDALQQFRAALKINPLNVDARFGEANALAALRRSGEAIAIYEALLRDQPTHANAHFKLANVLFDLDRLTEAAVHYGAALRANPNDAEAHHNLGTTFARMERWTDARREFETALRLKPDYAEAKRHLEQLRAVMGF